ncbi:MAG: hypothetical protein H0Z39_10520 [Peptococcaceae bacterium]|nr:hypothetical protein [Peptococcaceae bacterium]
MRLYLHLLRHGPACWQKVPLAVAARGTETTTPNSWPIRIQEQAGSNSRQVVNK